MLSHGIWSQQLDYGQIYIATVCLNADSLKGNFSSSEDVGGVINFHKWEAMYCL
jgi:hypothetical protein